jgi:transketolase
MRMSASSAHTLSPTHIDMANAIRALAMDGVEAAKSGHPGLPMGAADIATVLFTQVLKYDAKRPDWPDRDRFVLSAGHGSMLLYALLHLSGNADMTLDQIKRFRQSGSLTPGHPEYHHTPGVEMTTGPLGQGIATAVGMALAERALSAEFGADLVDHHTYVLASDGDLMEGISHEALALAGHFKLNRLIVLFDDNGITIDGPLSLCDSVDQVARAKACGWNAVRIDGHDPKAILKALKKAKTSDKPTLIACKTTIGYGSPKRAGTSKAHGEPLGSEELAASKAALGWAHGAFDIPDNIRAEWNKAGRKGASQRRKWEARLKASPHKDTFHNRLKGIDTKALRTHVEAHINGLLKAPQTLATRKSSELALESIVPHIPQLVLGSADLTGSNNTKTKAAKVISAPDYQGRYIHYGIREHGMAACMNGMALHGGFVPAGGTFLVFTDYARPSMRLAALMGLPAIYVMTHDSIGLGEDGPTHQPVEHVSSLRAMPNMRVFRPCDAVETAECWELALTRTDGPSVLALTRQNLPQLRLTQVEGNGSAKGAYELIAPTGKAKVVLLATGSEVEIAVEAKKMLEAKGIATRVISVPSVELFMAQSESYKRKLLGENTLKVAIEAGVRWGWDALIGDDGLFIGMSSFGASAPYKELYAHFGITAAAVVEKVQGRMK